MLNSPHLLIVGPDAKLAEEVRAALAGLPDVQAVSHTIADYRQGVEAARSRRPDLAVVEMGKNLRALTNFVEEVGTVAPDTAVAAAFAPDVFGPDVSESAILIEAIRAGVKDFLRRPLSSADLGQLLDRLVRRSVSGPVKLGTVLSFISNKGGVGKSTVAVSVACALAVRRPERVLLFDASLQMGVCASLLDVKPITTLTDAVRERHRLDETLLRQLTVPHDCGLHLLAAPASAVEAAEVDDESMTRVLTLARRSYDYVIVDTFPLFDRVVMAILDLCDRAYLVMESVVPTLQGGAKLIQLLDNLGYPKERQRLVLNRYVNSITNLKPADVAMRLGRDVDYIVPYQKQLIVAANLGIPYILRASRWFSRYRRVIDEMIEDILTLVPQPAAVRTPETGPPEANGVAGRLARKEPRP